MEVDQNDNPSQMTSFQVNKALHTGIVDLNRKRKLQVEQLELPLSKRKCSYKSLLSKPVLSFDEDRGTEDIHSSENEKSEIGNFDVGSETESEKGSNSFVGYFDMFEYGEANQRPSSSTTTFVAQDEIAHDPLFQCNELQASENLEDPLVTFESHFDYIYSQLANGCSEQFSKEEIDDSLFSNAQNPNNFVLSSGRWNVNQESQNPPIKKPTIDQEFEQYFSTLIL